MASFCDHQSLSPIRTVKKCISYNLFELLKTLNYAIIGILHDMACGRIQKSPIRKVKKKIWRSFINYSRLIEGRLQINYKLLKKRFDFTKP